MDSHEVRRHWAGRSGEYSPEYYAHYGPNETSETIRCILDRFLDRTAHILELGCSSGRHLSYLYDHGFENVAGIEVNTNAFEVMAEQYPVLAAHGEFYPSSIEAVVADFDDGEFDAIFSVETLQHLHPDAEWVFEELSRISNDLLITAENEGETRPDAPASPAVSYVNDEFPLYFRDWNATFTARGFVEVESTASRRTTLRTFRTTGGGRQHTA